MKKQAIPHTCGAVWNIASSIIKQKQGNNRKNRTGIIPKLVAPTFLKMVPKTIKSDNKNEIIKITNPIINVANKESPHPLDLLYHNFVNISTVLQAILAKAPSGRELAP